MWQSVMMVGAGVLGGGVAGLAWVAWNTRGAAGGFLAALRVVAFGAGGPGEDDPKRS